jgi:hypothetical protein
VLHDIKLAETLAGSTKAGTLSCSFSFQTQQKHPLARHSTCDFLGSGSYPGCITTILEENISRHNALQSHSFPPTQFWTLKTG